jgi:hypothetical protein
MAATPDHEEIARRARELWEQEGRPEGRHQEHWRQAEQELGGLPSEAAPMSPEVAGDEDTASPA